jgi:hypothetical protein
LTPGRIGARAQGTVMARSCGPDSGQACESHEAREGALEKLVAQGAVRVEPVLESKPHGRQSSRLTWCKAGSLSTLTSGLGRP